MEEQSRACIVERGGKTEEENSACALERGGDDRWKNRAEHAQWREVELETRRGER